MQAFTFDELNGNAQIVAILKLADDDIKNEHQRFHGMKLSDTFRHMGWHFNEHGERIA